MSDNVELIELSDAAESIAILRAFYDEVYVGEFPDENERESLDNMLAYLGKKSAGWYGDNNYHIVLLRADGQFIGAVIADYLAAPNTGVLEFLFVISAARGKGYAGKLLAYTETLIERDAVRAGYAQWNYIAAEMNDPQLTDASTDNMDPFVRARIWQRWGFRRADFRYVQPALSADQQAVLNLCLIVKPHRDMPQAEMPAATACSIVHDYLRWAMRIDEPADNSEFNNMAAELAGKTIIALTALA